MLDIKNQLPERINVLGVGISVINLDSAREILLGAAAQAGFAGYVTITGVHGVVESQKDFELKKIHNRSLLSTPDGMPMVWLGRWQNRDGIDRVYGPALMLEIAETTEGTKVSHFLFGGSDGVAVDLKKSLTHRFKGLNVVGTNTPPFRPLNQEEEVALYQELQNVRPHFFWVGLSTPKQEYFMHDFLAKYPDLTKDWDHGLVMLGVGAAFDFHTGRVRQAPRWIQRSGLEWLFRVFLDPKRLWKRYAYSISYFLWRIFPQMMGLQKYDMPK